jgi:uncharacterized delta-60 repeat protein
VSSISVVVAVLVLTLFPALAFAGPGDLDTTFSGDGKQTTDFPFGFSQANATVSQPDGKVVAVGSVLRSTSGDLSFNDFALARYNGNGTLDTTFSGDGKQRIDFGLDDQATGVALQPDGKIVVVGVTGFGGVCCTSHSFALARFNANGTLDTTFSGDGKQTTQFGDDAGAAGVALQDDGKIVAVGDTCTGDPDAVCDFALARYDSSGLLDATFSGDGKQTTDFNSIRDAAGGVALQGDGKIVAVGSTGNASGSAFDFALARYDSNGSLDASFSGDGMQTTDFGTGNDRAAGVAVQGDGKIVVGGPGGPGAAFARYDSGGSLDPTFSGDGKKTTDFFSPGDVALQADGKIVSAGSAGGDFALVRYNADGTPDPSFSGDGKQTTDFVVSAAAREVALQSDGKIVAVGIAGGNGSSFALARYGSDGSLDTTFSGDGKQTTSFGGYLDGAAAVAIQGDGKIIAAGHAGASSPDFAVARYNANGTLDTAFSADGKQTLDFGGEDEATAVAVQADGKIVVVGHAATQIGGAQQIAVARYNPNGTLDTTFSTDGKQMTDLGGFGATGVAIQGDGKIVVVGSACFNGCDFAVVRYNANGSLDTTFSGDGKQTTDFGAGSNGAAGVALQGAKIVVVGDGGPFPGDFAVARYNSNGTLDTTFSGDGKQTTDLGGSDGALALAVQSGKIVAVGRGGSGGGFALARYNANGSLDVTFSGDGKQTTSFGSRANGVAIQSTGKIVVVGGAGAGFALARYNSNGTLDTTFSGDGLQSTSFGFTNQIGGAFGVALQGGGKIVAVGVGQGPSQTDDFALARYLGN